MKSHALIYCLISFLTAMSQRADTNLFQYAFSSRSNMIKKGANSIGAMKLIIIGVTNTLSYSGLVQYQVHL